MPSCGFVRGWCIRKLAVLAAERGDHAEVLRLWEAVPTDCPGDREALARLGMLRAKPKPVVNN
jgi:hypothetical protein